MIARQIGKIQSIFVHAVHARGLRCLPGWRRKWADLLTLTRARAGRKWPVPKTDARIVFLVDFWVQDGLAQAHSEKIQDLSPHYAMYRDP